MLWDIAEYVSLCARRGRGITPKAHIGVELVLSLGCLACDAVLVVIWTGSLRPFTRIDIYISANVFLGIMSYVPLYSLRRHRRL
jgi:hypothetical protein